MVAAAAFIFASNGSIDWSEFFAMLIGTSLVIGSSCVFNNYLDIDLDKKMQRTKNRALVTGEVSVKKAIAFAIILGICGLWVLFVWTNLLTMIIGVVGMVFYIAIYGYAKRNSVHGTIVGSISGALPPVAGYTAATGSLDLSALILFLILVTWQMPHFYAIAIYRFKDYQSAGLPVLPIVQGIKLTQIQIMAYVLLYIIAVTSLFFFSSAGVSFLLITSTSGLAWLYLGAKGFRNVEPQKWARKMFFYSLIVLLMLSVMLALNPWLP